MGAVCCRPQPIDFDGEVTLFHFRLLKVVGKGAFGKVCPVLLFADRTRPHKSSLIFPGPDGSTQANPGNLCAQIHQQNQGREDEGSRKHHPGTEASREGLVPTLTHHSLVSGGLIYVC